MRGRFHREGPLDDGLRLSNNKVPTTQFQQRSSHNVVPTTKFQLRSSNYEVHGSNKTIQRNIGHIGLLFVGEKREANGFCGGIM